jgi:phospholipid-binding lipoprotein MlaA
VTACAGHRSPALLAVAAATLAGCATTSPDPIEPVNRGIFAFNESVDRYALEPVARGWDFVVPELVQTGFRNFFQNLETPRSLVNQVLQLKPEAFTDDLGRLVINTTVGVAGFLDVASELGIPRGDEDFGQSLGYWGVPPGAYVVLPLLGPSGVRDAVGRAADTLASPYGYFLSVPFWVSGGANLLDIVNLRAFYLEEIRENRITAVDYYVFVRNAYRQNRRKKVHDGVEMEEETKEDLYFFDDEEEGP